MESLSHVLVVLPKSAPSDVVRVGGEDVRGHGLDLAGRERQGEGVERMVTMAIPDFEELMLPLLNLATDGREHLIRDAIDRLATQFTLTQEDKSRRLPSSQEIVFDNRVDWACTYMKEAGLVKARKRGVYRITKRGQEVLSSNPLKIDKKFLMRFNEFVQFEKFLHEMIDSDSAGNSRTPEEWLENAHFTIRTILADDILSQARLSSPQKFEDLVVKLLVAMGYGGTLKDAGKAIGQKGDEGVDGVIKEDRLGLDVVFVQAKKWKKTVGRPEIQKFVGALEGQRATKGVFITTSMFSREAYDYVNKIDSKIVLIDGRRLARYMIDYNIGVTPVANYEVKRIDSDFFK